MCKIQWIKNDSPSLPVSTFVVDTDILIGDPTNIERKFKSLAEDIYMEFDVHVWFNIEIDSFTNKTEITVIDL